MIFEKIRQRTHGAEDEGKTVKHIFKYFDANGLGTIQLKEFKKALEILGCVFNDNDITAIFSKHDRTKCGKVDLEEFASYIALRGTG